MAPFAIGKFMPSRAQWEWRQIINAELFLVPCSAPSRPGLTYLVGLSDKPLSSLFYNDHMKLVCF